jgi:hypothetical protein
MRRQPSKCSHSSCLLRLIFLPLLSVPRSPSPQPGLLDMVFVIDGSGSVGAQNFNRTLNVAAAMVEQLSFSSNGTRYDAASLCQTSTSYSGYSAHPASGWLPWSSRAHQLLSSTS